MLDMTDNELLLAISNMLDPLRQDVKELRWNVKKLEGSVIRLEERVEKLEGRFEKLEGSVMRLEASVKKVELTQENVVLPRLQNIEACYTSTFERYKTSVEDHEQMKDDISLVKQVVMEHSEKLQKIS